MDVWERCPQGACGSHLQGATPSAKNRADAPRSLETPSQRVFALGAQGSGCIHIRVASGKSFCTMSTTVPFTLSTISPKKIKLM